MPPEWHLCPRGGPGAKICGWRRHARPATPAAAPRAMPTGPPSPGGAENGGKGSRWGPQTVTSVTESAGQGRWTGNRTNDAGLMNFLKKAKKKK